jgi:hypothetical protein
LPEGAANGLILAILLNKLAGVSKIAIALHYQGRNQRSGLRAMNVPKRSVCQDVEHFVSPISGQDCPSDLQSIAQLALPVKWPYILPIAHPPPHKSNPIRMKMKIDSIAPSLSTDYRWHSSSV